MNTNVKTCLFGGALLGAGLCSSATAGDFVWGSHNVFNYVSPIFQYAFSNSTGNVDVTVTDSYGSGSTATTSLSDFGVSMFAESGPGDAYHQGYGVAWTQYANFTVSMDMTVSLDWDLSGDTDGTFSYAQIDDLTNNGTVFSQTFNGSVGSTTVDLFAGVDYYFNAFIVSAYNGSGPSSFTMGDHTVNVVPLPPAAFGGLAMLAGLGAYRRVRR